MIARVMLGSRVSVYIYSLLGSLHEIMFMAKLIFVHYAPVVFLAQHFETFYGKRTALFLLHCHFDHHFWGLEGGDCCISGWWKD
jgi:hypothetical protein